MADPLTLEQLRELQDGEHKTRMTYAEWDQEIAKQRSNMNPGVGMMGHLNTNSRQSFNPRRSTGGQQAVGWNGRNTPGSNQQYGVPGVVTTSYPSQYNNERPDQPTPWIDDVDMSSIWYSPMQPVWPFGPPYYNRPREWNFPVGYNLNYVPERLATFGMLRGMRQSWGVLAAVIETRKDQLLRLPWTIQRREKPRASSKEVESARKFFRRPDGKLSYSQWSHKLLDDLFVIDAPCIYLSRDRGNKVNRAEIIDGATIFPLIDDAGRRPDSDYQISADGIIYEQRQPAFQQIIYGLPMINLSEDELIYAMMRPRPELPMFGFSPVEQILTEATEAIRKTFYQLEFWRSGSMPELMVTVPDAWNPRQIASFQAYFDALLSGQLTLKSKVRFVPGGMKPFDIKNASGESLWSQRDELLVRLVCYAFSVSPTPFVRQMNRGTAQSAQQQAQEEGLYPLMSWWKDDIMDRIIQDILGFDDVEFVFLPRPEVDMLKQAQIHQIQVREGMRSINEIREELGQEPIDDGDIPLIYTGAGAIPLSLVVEGGALAPGTPAVPGKPAASAKPNASPANAQPMRGPARPTSASPQPPQKPTPVHAPTAGAKKNGEIIDVEKALITYSEVRSAAQEAEKPKSKEQKKVGNYKKGHVWIQGLNITIETPKGKKRSGHDPDGSKWSSTMAGDYGYIRGTLGADGDQIDVCIGKHPKSNDVFVIDQIDAETGDFDEHKVFLGYRKPKAALRDYLDSNGDGLGGLRSWRMVRMSIGDFKSWLKSGNTKRPISSQDFGEPVYKSDTISTASGYSWYDQTVPVKHKKKKRKLPRGPRWLELTA